MSGQLFTTPCAQLDEYLHLPSPEPEPWPEALLPRADSAIRLWPVLCSDDHAIAVFLSVC